MINIIPYKKYLIYALHIYIYNIILESIYSMSYRSFCQYIHVHFLNQLPDNVKVSKSSTIVQESPTILEWEYFY